MNFMSKYLSDLNYLSMIYYQIATLVKYETQIYLLTIPVNQSSSIFDLSVEKINYNSIINTVREEHCQRGFSVITIILYILHCNKYVA